MDFNTIAVVHKESKVIAALRKDWLPLAISFLYEAFKRKHEVTLPYDTFLERFDVYLEHINSALSREQRFNHDAKYYIERWSSEDDLIRIRSREEGYIVQLSPHAERLLGWFDDLLQRGMIGTESRLRNILSMMDEVVTRSTDDAQTRLNYLYEQRERIDAEIQRIEETGEVDGLSDVQIRERLEHISGMASQLLRDFSAVEERFREMARDIQQAQLDPQARRGDILGTALDADEKLEASDEGQSFRAFYELLTHPDERNNFENLIGAIYGTPRLSVFVGDHVILRRLTAHLLEAGERVQHSNQRLAEHLRRVVDTRNVLESRRVQTLAQEIKHIASQWDDDTSAFFMSPRRHFHQVEADPFVDLPLERPLFDPPAQITPTERPRQATETIDAEALMALYDTFYIDESLLRDNIERLLMSRQQVTLAEVVTSYPVQQGIAEIISYMLLATRAGQHNVDTNGHETLTYSTPNDNNPRQVDVPLVVYRRAQ
jgi:hypothetical protein